jgi:hypothetical protein
MVSGFLDDFDTFRDIEPIAKNIGVSAMLPPIL